VGGEDPGAAGGGVVGVAAGSRVAGYRVEERIGQGGMAVVFRARDEQLDRLVALKILAPALAGDAEFRRRFTSESRAAAAIDDPHIVPVFAAGEADGVLFLAMRYVAGGDAQSLLKREGPLPPGRVAAIISPVASALDAAHRAGLVHRDVKPSNMLVEVLPGRPEHVYLSDFGLSKAVASTSGLTRAGTVLGTLDYLSPEQIAGRPVDGRADQYALACSAFELLAGVPPFRHDEPAAMMYAHLSEPPPPLASRRPGLPPAVDGVLSRALAKAPADRYASCAEFADALRDAFDYPPAETASPAAPGATWPGIQTSEEAATPSSVPRAVDLPATETRIPAVTPGGTPPGQFPGPIGSGQAHPRRRLRRGIAVAAFIAAAAGLTAGLLSGGPSKPAAKTEAKTVATLMALPISLKSAQSPVSGDVYVVYLGGQQASAEVYGAISKAANGEVARLYAQPFPFRNAPTQVSSVTVDPAGGTAGYEFQVTPTLATRYRVELFRSSTASTPLGTSGTATVYVIPNGEFHGTELCSVPDWCYSATITDVVPPSALQTEISKTWYLYFAINLAPDISPPVPKWLVLGAGNGHITALHRISTDEFSATVTLSYVVGNDLYDWAWRACAKATEAADGIGLPGPPRLRR